MTTLVAHSRQCRLENQRLLARSRHLIAISRRMLNPRLEHQRAPLMGQVCAVCTDVLSGGKVCEVPTPRGYVYAHGICHHVWWRESKAVDDYEVESQHDSPGL